MITNIDPNEKDNRNGRREGSGTLSESFDLFFGAELIASQ